MKIAELGPTDQVFTWVDPDTNETLHFAATKALFWCVGAIVRGECTGGLVPLNEQLKRVLTEQRSIDQEHVKSLTEQQAKMPIVICMMPDGTGLTIDGHHRAWAAFQRGDTEIRAFILEEPQWRRFIIEDVPQSWTDVVKRELDEELGR